LIRGWIAEFLIFEAMKNSGLSDHSDYVETPLGIFTAQGSWFYTNSEQIEKFAPGLLQKISVKELINDAGMWVRSSDAVSVWVLVAGLQLLPGYAAAVASVVTLLLWHLTKSAFISKISTFALKILTWEPLVVLAAVASISYAGISQNYSGVGYGLLFFILFRFGWIRRGFDSFYERYSGNISLNDRVMKMLIVQYAMQYSIPVTQLASMEEHIKSLMRKRNKPGKR